MFVEATRPSNDPEEYPSASSGSGPAGAGGTRIGYDHEKLPVFVDTSHDADGDRDVADQSPDEPDSSAVIASIVDDGSASVADSVWDSGSFIDASGFAGSQSPVMLVPASSAPVNWHSGISTRRRRSDQPPPKASAMVE